MSSRNGLGAHNQRSLLPKKETTTPPLKSSSLVNATTNNPNSKLEEIGEPRAPKRRCISNACMPCRKRKSKCDGVHPSCHACSIVYGSACFYDVDSDHRRKGALKRDIAQLSADLEPRNDILDAIRKSSEADADDIVQLIRSNPDESWETIANSVKKINSAAIERKPSWYLEGELDDFSIETSTKPGEPRQYGHTSNLHLQEDQDTPGPEIAQLGSWTHVTNNHELIKHLLDVYLSWAHPSYMFFSEEIFLHGIQDRKLKYCTPLLVNAVLAVGCHFSDRPEARADPNDPSSVGNHFYAEADRLLRESTRPCLTTVQALGLMSLHQAMNSNDSSGWNLMCQAIGMVIELGLHKETPPNGKITPSEVVARQVTFWGTYFLQTAWTICVGRLSLLPRTAIRTGRPTLVDLLELKIWTPVGHPGYSGGASPLAQPGFAYTILLHSSLLCEIVDDIVHMFYAPRDRITSRKLQMYHNKLREWYGNLPDALRIKYTSPNLPQVISLNVYYHNCVIQLFRPFMKVSFVQAAATPRQICVESATQVSKLMTMYKQIYGLRRVSYMFAHCSMTAAIIHLVTLSAPNMPPDLLRQTEIYVADIVYGLIEMHRSFSIVERYLKAIRALALKWLQDVPTIIQEAMQDAEISSPKSTESAADNISAQAIHQATQANQEGLGSRKPSVPALAPMTMPMQYNQNTSVASLQPPTQHQQQYYWTPFPNTTDDGMPLALPSDPNQLMDISNMLDSGTNGDWPELNRDGFTLSREDEAALWGLNWDQVPRNGQA